MTRKPHALETAAMVFLIVMFLVSMVCAENEPRPSPAVTDAIADASAAARAAERPEPWLRE